MTWQKNGSSKRRLELPANWYTEIRPAVISRDGGRCVQCGEPGRDVDHINDPHDHRLSNLRLLCPPCHKVHTQRQASRARATRQAKGRRRSEPNPGLRER